MGARKEEFERETIILKEGAGSKRMYIVLEGEVILYHDYGLENEYVLGACGKGKTFGEMNLFSDSPCMYTAVAFTDVKLAWFERNNLDSFVKGYPESAVGLFENIAKSYILLGENLQMAIDEINHLKSLKESDNKAAVSHLCDNTSKTNQPKSGFDSTDFNPTEFDPGEFNPDILDSGYHISDDDDSGRVDSTDAVLNRLEASVKKSGSYHFIGKKRI